MNKEINTKDEYATIHIRGIMIRKKITCTCCWCGVF